MIGRLLGLKRPHAKARASELLEAFGLADAAGRLVKHYSGGMRRRLRLGASIVVTPELMFLDEPTTGLDPRSRNRVWLRKMYPMKDVRGPRRREAGTESARRT